MIRDNLNRDIRDFAKLSEADRSWVVSQLAKDTSDIPEMIRRGIRDALEGRPRQPALFISYSHDDKKFVEELRARLEDERISVWLDDTELSFGDSLIDRLSHAIRTVDLVLVVLSPSAVASHWVQEELRQAVSRQIAGRDASVIPIVKEKCEIPAFLVGRLYGDFTTKRAQAKNFPRLIESIRRHSGNLPIDAQADNAFDEW